MSLRPRPGAHVPEETARVARAAFPHGHPSLTLRDALETIYTASCFEPICPQRGHAAASPGRLALVAVWPFAANLSARQAANAVRSRLDWQ